ncbi:simple sugar transport system permease protein [Hathewaya proteolytica DSM 3090]|uniref:Simple sugar transport system permease protein n=1 Tax=Hathewaya proteolytica DSM 3090 TaxID=1121331 RepID=A0A1M6R5P4_9CLOT|nr:ABC transporter permease [Hathewaya proteolytica]SHK27746.1 simple sugar transport system permease protein [Hathewaya proteolytica DSM 3090]
MKNKHAKYEIVRTIVAIAAALLLALCIIFLVSQEPLNAVQILLIGPLDSIRHVGNVLEMAIPLIFTGLAVSVMYQAKQFNLGAEGAFYIGGIAAAYVAIKFSLPMGLHPTVAILLGAFMGAIAGLIPGYLKAKYKATELVSSLMLNYILLYLGTYILQTFLRDAKAGSLVSLKFQETAKLVTGIIPETRIHSGLFIVISMIIITYIYLYRTKWGYELRVTGENPDFARYSGINTFKVIIISQVIGCSIAGMGGATEVLGMYSRFQWSSLPGYGWDGVIVAILARNNPLFVPLAAIFLAYLRTGADLMSRMTDVQSEFIAIIQGIMILLIAAERFLSYWKKKSIYKEVRAMNATVFSENNQGLNKEEKGEER